MARSLARSRLTPILVALLTLLAPRLAPAVEALESARSIRVGTAIFDPACNCEVPITRSATDPLGAGPWDAALSAGTATASQRSLVDLLELHASGSVASIGQSEFAETRYHVVFEVAAATTYSFEVDNVDAGLPTFSDADPGGLVALDRVDPGDFGLVLQPIHSVKLGRIPSTGMGLPDFATEGALAPGVYRLDYRLSKNATHFYADPGGAGFVLTFVPALVLNPERSLVPPGGGHTVSVRVEDSPGSPVPGVSVEFGIADGPNAGVSGVCSPDADCRTGSDGRVSFSYQSNGVPGIDRIRATAKGATSNEVVAAWDADCNGNEVADSCDLSCEGFDGWCADFAGCGTSVDGNGDLVPDECNAPPDCSPARADPSELWPPSNRPTPVVVRGVTDADGDAVAVSITSIHQDEPAIRGIGRFGPDGQGVGTARALLRADRRGGGDGRVYHVGFSADDGRGGGCTGTVSVCVPHDLLPGHVCVDQGALFDSTVGASGSRGLRRR